MAQSYPPDGTFFDTLKKSFTDVPVDETKDNAISTTEFLEAAESLVTLFGEANSTYFHIPAIDLHRSILSSLGSQFEG